MTKPIVRKVAWLIGAVSMWANSVIDACPVCDTATGQRVRAGIWDGHFGHNLLLMALPFAVFAVLVALLRFGVPWPYQAQPLTDAGSASPLA